MIGRRYPFPPVYGSQPPYFNPYTANPMNPDFSGHYYPTPFDVFAKPKQPMNWPFHPQSSDMFSQPQPAMPKNLLHYFQNDKGELDVDKMMSTAGQVANTVQQVSPVVKQVGDLMKQFR